MLQKDKSTTTSSKSTTSKTNLNSTFSTGMDTPIQFVKGVGPKLGAMFKSRMIETVGELLYFLPRDYEDRSQIFTVSTLKEEVKATVTVRVVSQRLIPTRFGRSLLEVKCADHTGTLSLKWFHAPRGMEKRFTPGTQFMVTGKVKLYQGRPEIVHPEITWGVGGASDDDSSVQDHHNVGRVVPVYVELEGIASRTLRKVLWEALEKFGQQVPEDLPEYLLQRRSLPSVGPSIWNLHFPPDSPEYTLEALMEATTPAHRRLIYGEFFKFEFLMMRQKLNVARASAQAFGQGGGVNRVKELIQSLPFQLTRGQIQSIQEILDDLKQPHPMNRLVQGDVGSGKTAVALLTASCVLAEGSQAALMAPTEILAEQHLVNAKRLFAGQLNVALLTGKTSQLERNQLLQRLQSGEPILLIGTHALIEDPVVFSRLDFIMIDEQHRFGVDQRKKLKDKGNRLHSVRGKTLIPHTLILTATPIPRTLALTAFADLTVSTIKELPAGRSPITTQVVRDRTQRLRAYERIRDQLRQGRQAYFIFPLVNDSEAEGFTHLKSAVSQAEHLAQEVFPEFKVGLLHGQMRADQKSIIMDQFKQGLLHILVSTTVVEVGVDVPNATVMVIEHAERFGLSQLHQLRGRVGRGVHASHCFLFAGQTKEGSATSQRLEVLEETQDGFKIAEADLEIRGPGEFLGTRQSGGLPFKIAHLVRDRDLLLESRDDALAVLKEDPDLEMPHHLALREYFKREGTLQFGRLGTF